MKKLEFNYLCNIMREFGSQRTLFNEIKIVNYSVYWKTICACGEDSFVPQRFLENGKSLGCRSCIAILRGKRERFSYDDVVNIAIKSGFSRVILNESRHFPNKTIGWKTVCQCGKVIWTPVSYIKINRSGLCRSCSVRSRSYSHKCLSCGKDFTSNSSRKNSCDECSVSFKKEVKKNEYYKKIEKDPDYYNRIWGIRNFGEEMYEVFKLTVDLKKETIKCQEKQKNIPQVSSLPRPRP